MGVGLLSVPASVGRARKRRREKEEGGRKGAMPGWKEEPTIIRLLAVFGFLLQLMHVSAPLSRMDCTFALIRCYNEMEKNLANTRLRFKCLE